MSLSLGILLINQCTWMRPVRSMEGFMEEQFITLTLDTLEQEHLCCAISDKKHQPGVLQKKAWTRDRIAEGHVFRKLDTKERS